MNIALLGYGRMGKAIEEIALQRKHQIIIKTSTSIGNEISKADVAIDFSIPSAAVKNITNCLHNNIPVISGTTGWLDDYENMVTLCKEKKGAFIYASNFSLGVNIFFELNKNLANMMASLKQYDVDIEEIHHTKKIDAPSGTAITLANDIIKKNSTYQHWKLNTVETGKIPILAKRIADVPGTHSINYKSKIDTITIKHEAHNRKGFGLGAVIASEWIVGKKGVFSMKDVLGLNSTK